MSIEGPDESQRIEDVEKARVMAEKIEEYRNQKIERLQKALDLPWAETIKDGYRKEIMHWENIAEVQAELEGAKYDAEKESLSMTPEEIQFRADEIGEAYKAAWKEMIEARQLALIHPSSETESEKEKAEALEQRLSLQSFAWERVLKSLSKNS